MKKSRLFVWVLQLLLGVSTAYAAEPRLEADSLVDIREVEILGQRPMKEIGVQKTAFDSVILNEHIALSIADVLNFNSSIFVKHYGRATLSTASFRGTSPAHTQVLWNGMKINSPMLGMTDFSMIPACFVGRHNGRRSGRSCSARHTPPNGGGPHAQLCAGRRVVRDLR